MRIVNPHEALAAFSHSFSLDALSNRETESRIRRALAEHGRLLQRASPLQPVLVMWFLLAMTLFRALSIPNVFKQLIAMLRRKKATMPLAAVTDGALAHARVRLGSAPFKSLFESLAADVVPEPSFHGLRPWAVDGVHMTMPDTPANVKAFKRPASWRAKPAWPQMKVVTLTDTVTHGIRAARMAPCDADERQLARPLLDMLSAADLGIVDRGLYAAPTLHRIDARGAKYLARIPGFVKPRILRVLGHGDYLVEITIHRKRAKKHRKGRSKQRRRHQRTERRKFVARMVTYRVKGEKAQVRLLTNLMDVEKFPARELVLLYHERWEVELGYDEVKTHLQTVAHGTQHTAFRSKSPEMVEQEFWAMLCAYNLVRILIAEAASTHGMLPREISFVDALVVIKASLPEIQDAPARRLIWLHRHLLRDIADCKLDRPRRPRVYPRVVKVKMSNYKKKRRTHRQSFRVIELDLALVRHRVA